MNVAQYIAEYCLSKEINKCFSVTGGFAMHLNDAFGSKLDVLYTHGEQSAGYSALGWSSFHHKPSICCTTSGCGATNAITPCLISYQDSVPVLFISGQVHKNDNIHNYGGSIRCYFGSDCDIVSCVSKITKYAIEVTNVREIREILNKCIYNLTEGRLGPVWLSVPLDIQGQTISENLNKWIIPIKTHEKTLGADFLDIWQQSERPVILAGNGIHISNTKKEFRSFIRKHRIPYVVSFFGSDLGADYIGKTGLIGNRSGNFAIQNADLILCLGSRLSKSITGYNRELFGREAKVILVDIDESEFITSKRADVHVRMDLKTFFKTHLPQIHISTQWLKKTQEWKQLWSCELPPKEGSLICPYRHLYHFFTNKASNSVVVMSSGSIYCVGWHMYQYKDGDRFITSGHGDMGYEISVAMGVSLHKKRTFAIVGDGSFHYNIQDLITIKFHNMPITIMVFNNNGYGAIKMTQNNVFGREFGTTPDCGLGMYNIKSLANASNIPYYSVSNDDDIDYLHHCDGPIIVEIKCETVSRYPKLANKPLANGKFKNLPYEEMAPFLDKEILEQNMFISRI